MLKKRTSMRLKKCYRHVNIATAYFIITYTYLYDTPEKKFRKLLEVATPTATPRLRNAVVSPNPFLKLPVVPRSLVFLFVFFCHICKTDVKLISYCFKCEEKFCQSNIKRLETC